MKNLRSSLAVTLAAVLLFALLIALTLTSGPSREVTAAPAAAPTPAGYTTSNQASRYPVEFMRAVTMTADTRQCFELADYDVIDLHTVITQGVLNTTTIRLFHTNDMINFAAGTVGPVVGTSTADANTLDQYHLFGRWSCVTADLTNGNVVTVTAIGVAK